MNSPKNYSQLNSELEAIVDRLQSSDLDVDEIINEYQKGIKLVDQMESYLKSARNKIAKVTVKKA